MKFEKTVESLLPEGNGPFDVIAYELTHDGQSWSVNTPFKIASGVDREAAISVLRSRWEVFKVNYSPRARVADLSADGEEDYSELEVDYIPFARVEIGELVENRDPWKYGHPGSTSMR